MWHLPYLTWRMWVSFRCIYFYGLSLIKLISNPLHDYLLLSKFIFDKTPFKPNLFSFIWNNVRQVSLCQVCEEIEDEPPETENIQPIISKDYYCVFRPLIKMLYNYKLIPTGDWFFIFLSYSIINCLCLEWFLSISQVLYKKKYWMVSKLFQVSNNSLHKLLIRQHALLNLPQIINVVLVHNCFHPEAFAHCMILFARPLMTLYLSMVSLITCDLKKIKSLICFSFEPISYFISVIYYYFSKFLFGF